MLCVGQDGEMGRWVPPGSTPGGSREGGEPERAAAALFVLQPLREPAEYFPVFICGKA